MPGPTKATVGVMASTEITMGVIGPSLATVGASAFGGQVVIGPADLTKASVGSPGWPTKVSA
jgi:hypothetical protein